MMRSSSLALVAILGLAASAPERPPRVDPGLPAYTPVDGLSGSLIAAGSDTMLVLQTLMAEAFRRVYPQVTVEIEGKGSSTGPPALTESAVNIANMSRRIFASEEEGFEERFGYAPVRVDVALDTVGIFVHRDNPIPHLSLAEVDAVFSTTRRCGAPADLSVWGQLGLDGRWRTAPISLFGRNAASGTYGYFKNHALCRGDFKATVKEQPGSASVVQGVGADRYGIGYSGIGYATPGVRAVPILVEEGAPPVSATFANAANGRYPFARFLEVYINKAPGTPLDRLTFEYIRFMLSADGQRVVIRAGFHPLDAATAEQQLGKIAG
ncbi:MAG: phosphate ABC transporter substrate-binding protein [Thermoanaerobaculales bacterium]|nr:phosphate ABC transporter substrate-binding protein [Thermoanaerobaculales bacterium]